MEDKEFYRWRYYPSFYCYGYSSCGTRTITWGYRISAGQELSLGDIAYQLDEYLAVFGHARVFDASTIRKKLNEYVKEGVLLTRKNGKCYCQHYR